MLKNHAVEIFPKENVTGITLDSPISIKFDSNVQSVDTDRLFSIKDANWAKIDGKLCYIFTTYSALMCKHMLQHESNRISNTIS
jgi:hypothetical protein